MICSKCQREIPEEAIYCPHCGERTAPEQPGGEVSAAERVLKPAAVGRRLKCPKCGQHRLQPVTENTASITTSTTTKGGGYSGAKGCLGVLMFGPCGLLCGNCGSSAKTNTSTNTEMTSQGFFVCQDCGNKFRNPVELKEELDELEQRYQDAAAAESAFKRLQIVLKGIMNNNPNAAAQVLLPLAGMDLIFILGAVLCMFTNNPAGVIWSFILALFPWALLLWLANKSPKNLKKQYDKKREEYEQFAEQCYEPEN